MQSVVIRKHKHTHQKQTDTIGQHISIYIYMQCTFDNHTMRQVTRINCVKNRNIQREKSITRIKHWCQKFKCVYVVYNWYKEQSFNTFEFCTYNAGVVCNICLIDWPLEVYTHKQSRKKPRTITTCIKVFKKIILTRTIN